jgi:hypothetical protein
MNYLKSKEEKLIQVNLNSVNSNISNLYLVSNFSLAESIIEECEKIWLADEETREEHEDLLDFIDEQLDSAGVLVTLGKMVPDKIYNF